MQRDRFALRDQQFAGIHLGHAQRDLRLASASQAGQAAHGRGLDHQIGDLRPHVHRPLVFLRKALDLHLDQQPGFPRIRAQRQVHRRIHGGIQVRIDFFGHRVIHPYLLLAGIILQRQHVGQVDKLLLYDGVHQYFIAQHQVRLAHKKLRCGKIHQRVVQQRRLVISIQLFLEGVDLTDIQGPCLRHGRRACQSLIILLDIAHGDIHGVEGIGFRGVHSLRGLLLIRPERVAGIVVPDIKGQQAFRDAAGLQRVLILKGAFSARNHSLHALQCAPAGGNLFQLLPAQRRVRLHFGGVSRIGIVHGRLITPGKRCRGLRDLHAVLIKRRHPFGKCSALRYFFLSALRNGRKRLRGQHQPGQHRVGLRRDICRAVKYAVALPLFPQISALYDLAALRVGIGIHHGVHGDAPHIHRLALRAGIVHHAPAHGGAQRFARLGKEVLFVHIALLRPCQAEIRGGFPGIDPYIAIPFRNAVASVHLKREPQRFACIGGIRLFRRRRKCGQQHNRRKKTSHSPAVLAFHPRTLLSKT